jgi:hypothetical protein
VVKPIAASWTDWTHSATVLEEARQQLGQRLNHFPPPQEHLGALHFDK